MKIQKYEGILQQKPELQLSSRPPIGTLMMMDLRSKSDRTMFRSSHMEFSSHKSMFIAHSFPSKILSSKYRFALIGTSLMMSIRDLIQMRSLQLKTWMILILLREYTGDIKRKRNFRTKSKYWLKINDFN